MYYFEEGTNDQALKLRHLCEFSRAQVATQMIFAIPLAIFNSLFWGSYQGPPPDDQYHTLFCIDVLILVFLILCFILSILEIILKRS